MTIHAKSLNQLAAELQSQAEQAKSRTTPKVAAIATLSKPVTQAELWEVIKVIEDFTASLSAGPKPAPVISAEAERPPAHQRSQQPEDGFFMDSTLGLRTRPCDRAIVAKRESDFIDYGGFASQADITGKH